MSEKESPQQSSSNHRVTSDAVTDGLALSVALATDLARAIEGDEFYLVYQPEIDLRTNGFAGVEALIRWRHPARGVISPKQFIPLLESSGQIVEVGNWALETACNQGAEWHAKGYRFSVAVNTSAQQLRGLSFVADVTRLVSTSGLNPSHLTLEFSYTTLADHNILDHLAQIRACGIRLAIDDFAPGQPDIGALAKIPVDIVKLDRNYVIESKTSLQKQSQIRQLVHDMRILNLRIIASGVEDVNLRNQLQDDQVDVGQGFLFARPFEVDEIDQFLKDFALFSGRPLWN